MKRYVKASQDEKFKLTVPLNRWAVTDSYEDGDDVDVIEYSWVEFPYQIDVVKRVERRAIDGMYDFINHFATITNLETGRSWTRENSSERQLFRDIENSINV